MIKKPAGSRKIKRLWKTQEEKKMVVVNTENIPGREYQVISLVTGCCVMCKNIGKDIGASFRNMVGGEMQAYTQMMADAKVYDQSGYEHGSRCDRKCQICFNNNCCRWRRNSCFRNSSEVYSLTD